MNNAIFITKAKATAEANDKVRQALIDVASAARKQDGCVDYKILLAEDGSTVNLEIWSSSEARDAFNDGPDVAAFIEAVSGNFAESPQPVSYEEIG